MAELASAVKAIEADGVIVYPTDTVYGLGANAFSPTAIDRVFSLKGRDRSEPLSVAIPSIDEIDRVAKPSPLARRLIAAFLPGPVTVICQRHPAVPDRITAGGDRVGIRIPDHAVARSLLSQTPPLTATSANVSGGSDVGDLDALSPAIRSGVDAIVDGGTTGGQPSTVVDPDRGIIQRRGQFADAIEAWLADHSSDSC